jgi:flagellar basal body-associated protein FliL
LSEASVSLNYFLTNGYDEGMSERKARILELLRKLEKLKQDGLLTEEEYRVRREKLIDAFLQEEEYAYYESGVEEKPPQKSKAYTISIILLICSLILLGAAGYYFFSLSREMHPITTTISLIIPETKTEIITMTKTATKTITYERIQTITSMTPIYVYPNYTLYTEYATYPTSRIVYSGSVTLERDCSMKRWSIQANKGDVISVYWESNDYSTYVAIGSDADLERNRQYYCEVMISFWKTSWPAADYGYSGRLEFRAPSSGTWYVIIANGNWECIFSECPITVTRLEITHISS